MADEQIDSLHIDISETGAQHVISSFEALISNSTALEASLSRLMSQLNSINPSFSSVASGAVNVSSAMRQVDNINLDKITDNASSLSTELESVGSAAAKLSAEITSGGGNVDFSTYKNAVADLQQARVQMESLSSNPDSEQFKVASRQVDELTAKVINLEAQLSKPLTDSQFEQIARQSEKAERKIELLNAKKIDNTPKQPDEEPVSTFNSDAVLQLGKQIGIVDGKMVGLVTTAGKLAPAIAATAPALIGIGSAIGLIVKLGKFAINETKKVASFMATALKAGAEKAVEHIKSKIEKLTSPIKALFNRIGRIALYRLMRSAMREIVDAFTTGIQNLAKEMESANKVMSVYSTRLMYLKNTLGAALIPLLQALTPLFLRVTNAVIKAADGINQFLSLLNGKTTYIKAKEQYVDYAASLDKSTKKAKKSIKNLTASFDELHDITETATSGDETDYTNYFTTAGIEADIDGFYKKILEGFQKGDLTQVGYILANKINESISKLYSLVSWDKVGEKVTRYARSLASLVTTLVNEVNFEQIALTFAEGLNTVVRAVNTFMEQLFTDNTFTNLGANLGAMLYTAITNIDWAGIGRYFLEKLIAVFNVAQGFLSYMLTPIDKEGKLRVTAMVESIFNGLSDALKENASKIESFGQTISDFFVAVFEAGAAMFGNTDFWTQLANSIKKVIDKIRENKDRLTESLTKFVKALVGMVAEFLKVVDISAIMRDVADIILNVIHDPEVKRNLQTIGEEMGEIAGQWFAIKFQAKLSVLPSIIRGSIAGAFTGIGSGLFGVATTAVKKIVYPKAHAEGGFPEDGLFLANHTELVGKFSNGKTAVANNEQIIEGVAGGVERGMLAAMSASGSNNGSGSNEYNFYIDAKKMAKALAKDVFGEANRAGLTLRTAKA